MRNIFNPNQLAVHLLWVLIVALSGCSNNIGKRIDIASQIAVSANLVRKDITAPPFMLASWYKLNTPNAPINLYIEGDGFAWISRSTPSGNPTPKTPIALALAGEDPSGNVIYLARPCQYTDFSLPHNKCNRSYWMGKRFAEEVVSSYNTALNQIAKETKTTGFNLIGYSGGANIAGLLAAKRKDILSIRTVAGNVDNDFFTKFHKVSSMPYSLNMADYANKLRYIPQYHFVAEEDKFVPLAISQSYTSKAKPSSCVKVEVINGTDHKNGWQRRWKNLLAKTPKC